MTRVARSALNPCGLAVDEERAAKLRGAGVGEARGQLERAQGCGCRRRAAGGVRASRGSPSVAGVGRAGRADGVGAGLRARGAALAGGLSRGFPVRAPRRLPGPRVAGASKRTRSGDGRGRGGQVRPVARRAGLPSPGVVQSARWADSPLTGCRYGGRCGDASTRPAPRRGPGTRRIAPCHVHELVHPSTSPRPRCEECPAAAAVRLTPARARTARARNLLPAPSASGRPRRWSR